MVMYFLYTAAAAFVVVVFVIYARVYTIYYYIYTVQSVRGGGESDDRCGVSGGGGGGGGSGIRRRSSARPPAYVHPRGPLRSPLVFRSRRAPRPPAESEPKTQNPRPRKASFSATSIGDFVIFFILFPSFRTCTRVSEFRSISAYIYYYMYVCVYIIKYIYIHTTYNIRRRVATIIIITEHSESNAANKKNEIK